MAELIYTRDNIIQRGEVAKVAVYTKAQWQDAWLLQPTFKVNYLEHTVHGSIGKAEFFQNYGTISQELGPQSTVDGYQVVVPIRVEDHWVKIDYTPVRVQTADPNTLTNVRDGMVVFNTTAGRLERLTGGAWVPATDLSVVYSWYGVIAEVSDNVFGADTAQTGDQTYTAYSLEYLLSKKQIFESYMFDSVFGPGRGPDNPRVIPRGIPFNGGRSDGRSSVNNIVGNRGPKLGGTTTPGGDPLFGFAENLKIDESPAGTDDDNAIPWTVAEIVDHLLAFHTPTDNNAPLWDLQPASTMKTYLEQFPFIDVETHGRTVLDVLNQVFDRRRGFSWWIEVFEDQVDPQLDRFYIRADSYVSTDLPLTVSALPANTRQYTLDWTNNPDARSNQVYFGDSLQSYNKVVVTGAPYGAVGTIRAGTEMEKDWTPAEESAYDTANSNSYGGITSAAKKESINDNFRLKSPRDRVFTQFYIADDWDQNTYTNIAFFPTWSGLSNPTPADVPNVGLWIAGLRIHNFLLLREGWDYTSNPPVDNNKSGTVGDYLRCTAFGQAVVSGNTYWTSLDRRSEGAFDEEFNRTAGLTVSCSITPLAEKAGLSIKPNGMPHLLSNDTNKTYSDLGVGSNAAISVDRNSQIDGSTIHCTVYMTHDRIVSQEETVDSNTKHNTNTTLYIQLGERAHYDLLCPQTVLSADDDGQNLVVSPNEYVVLRDDRQMLRDLAICAAEWYSRDRQSIQVSHDQIIGDYLIGSLITNVSLTSPISTLVGHGGNFVVGHGGSNVVSHGVAGAVVNSMVTNVRHDFANMTTSVRTSFTELDFAGLAG